uniref:helix-turn-helix domain-containing protein n=1 Tax=Yersinia frederiksenii TaxID=29484 RepID=UPI001F4C1BCD|nr:helix-turn-helix domain-containing protein [Yersinia frederiksenii]ULG19762.1 AraC family transcriptional regulator [Yersinia frederiksenii]
MIAQGIILPLNVIKEGESFNLSDQELWLVTIPDNASVQLNISKAGSSMICKLECNCILLLDRININATWGDLIYHKIRIDILSKLLAFIDEAQNVKIAKNHDIYFNHIDFTELNVLDDRSAAESWFLSAYIERKEWINPLCDFLRNFEHYDLVRYLLSQSMGQNTLYDLGKTYGVSYSHFRRLCSSALGGKVKAELCNWRMAKAVFEIIEGESDMTSIAYKYGYSSSSHFSSDIKNRLGKTPRELCKKP